MHDQSEPTLPLSLESDKTGIPGVATPALTTLEHARKELEALLSSGDAMSVQVAQDVLALLACLVKQEHTGFSLGYVLDLLTRLAKQQAITELTDTPEQWHEVESGSDERLYQHVRDSRFFKNASGTWYVNALCFEPNTGYEGVGGYETVYVQMPYRPIDTVYVSDEALFGHMDSKRWSQPKGYLLSAVEHYRMLNLPGTVAHPKYLAHFNFKKATQ